MLLLNIKKFCELYNIPAKPNHLLWINDNFDYPNPNKNNNINNIIYEFDILRITDMTNQQDEFIRIYFNDNNCGNLTINNMDIEDSNYTDEDSFEVERILKHRKFKKRIKYYVKWKGYDDTYNEWIWQEDFNDTVIIDDYTHSLENR